MHERIKGYLDKAGIGYTSYEGPGRHSWEFWNQELGKVLGFLGFGDDGQRGF